MAREWWNNNLERWSKGHANLIWHRLEQNIFPWVGHRSIAEISSRELLETLRRIEKRGAIETARRVNQVCGQIFLYGIASGYCENNPAAGLSSILRQRKTVHFAAITDPAKVRMVEVSISAISKIDPERTSRVDMKSVVTLRNRKE